MAFTKRGVGQPSKFTKQRKQIILGCVRRGLTEPQACKAASMGIITLKRWKKKAADGEAGGYVKFIDDLRKAEVDAIAFHADNIYNAAKGGQVVTEYKTETSPKGVVETVTEKKSLPNWSASAWYLERKDPANWGKKETVKLELDWRASLVANGIDADAIFEKSVERAIPLIAANEE